MGVGLTVAVGVGSGVYGAGVDVAGNVATAKLTSSVAVGTTVGVGVSVTTCPQAVIKKKVASAQGSSAIHENITVK